jgi:hypothetical protein
MTNACKFIAAKLAACVLVLGLLVAPLCTLHCAAHACTSPSSTENGTPACHHQFSSYPVAGFAAQSCSDSCNSPELVLEIPRIQVQPAASMSRHSAMSGQSAVLILTSAQSETLNATPSGWSILSLSPTSFEPCLPAVLRL